MANNNLRYDRLAPTQESEPRLYISKKSVRNKTRGVNVTTVKSIILYNSTPPIVSFLVYDSDLPRIVILTS